MTLKEFAASVGVSVQAVYKRLKANGLNLDQLRDKETGHFTDEGLKAVEKIFSQNSTKSTEVDKLKTEVERLKTQVEMLTNERDHLREENRALLVLQQETLRRIPAALPAPEKKRGFPWFSRKKHE